MKPLILLPLLLFTCQASSQTLPVADSQTQDQLAIFQALAQTHIAQPCSADEPGTRMQLMVEIVSKETGQAVPHEALFLYHTTQEGVYETSVPQDPTTAKLKAHVQTDEKGRFLIQSIVPGQYPRANNPPHIHLQLDAAHPPYFDILFDHKIGRMGRRQAERHDQTFIAQMYQGHEGELIGYVRIEVKNYENR
jgi:protocatechuate 3,4-dioxygenase beta subunit